VIISAEPRSIDLLKQLELRPIQLNFMHFEIELLSLPWTPGALVSCPELLGGARCSVVAAQMAVDDFGGAVALVSAFEQRGAGGTYD
jgi:hypothetical protein